MQRVFGLPVGALAITLTALVGLAGAAIGLLALRHRVFFRMGVRNIRRRPARSSLIVAGLMLGTAIIASALTTGDTMGHTVRSDVITALGGADEHVTAKGTAQSEMGQATVQWFPAAQAASVVVAAAQDPDVDGVAPAVVETVAVQDRTSRQNEPRITLFATDPAAAAAFAPLKGSASWSALGPGEVYLDAEAADSLDAAKGDRLVLLAGARMIEATVRDVVDVDGAGSAQGAVLMPLERAQAALGRAGAVTHILVSNRGGFESGVTRTDAVVARLLPKAEAMGLDVSPVKQDGLDTADAQGNAFVTMFTTFGSFSMAAGILLIFLVFVMLAAERRGEMGMARAVGTQRRHLIETFLYEGAAYDVAAAAVGAALGVGVAYGMVAVIAGAFAAEDFELRFAVEPRSLVIAYGIGVLLTLAVVSLSAWRVSRLNIVSAIRDIPEEHSQPHARRRWVRAGAGLLVGGLVMASGASAGQGTPFGLGVSIVIASLVLVAVAAGLSPRLAYSVAGLLMVTWWLLPPDLLPYVRDLSQDISIWIVGGLAVVIGATWVVMWNADVLLGAALRTVGRVRSLAPVLKMSMAYPLRDRFRTAVTLSMFMLVVFTLVTGSVIPGSIMTAVDNEASFAGGFDIQATTSAAGALPDMRAAAASVPGIDPAQFDAVASQSVVPLQVAQEPVQEYSDYMVRGADDSYLAHTTYGFAARATGYQTDRDVWAAMAANPNLAVVDSMVAPRRDQFMVGGVLPEFALTGFYTEDGVFDPVPVTVFDPGTGTTLHVKVIGVITDMASYEMTAGLWLSQKALAPLGDRARPTIHYFSLNPAAPGSDDPAGVAATLERSFLANGMEAESVADILGRAVGQSRTMIRLIQGFMGLGLLVGVAALGVISARSVVERRQQIGVLRAIGFQPAMIRRTLLLESSMIAVTAIVIGTGLGLVMAAEVVGDMAGTPGWANLSVHVPWASLGVVFGIVYAAALATTWLPALRASRIYPAEALRYA